MKKEKKEEIKKKCYKEYALSWVKERCYRTEELLHSYHKYIKVYIEDSQDFDIPSFEEYCLDFNNSNNTIFSSYKEFLNNEFYDKEEMTDILKKDKSLLNEYLKFLDDK